MPLRDSDAAAPSALKRPKGRAPMPGFLSLLALVILTGCGERERAVVVYTSQDQVYAEPVFSNFWRQSGIKVLPIFDSESIKTAGLVQRLLAERNHPKADVFWSNESMMSYFLVERGVLDTNAWTRVGFRTRRLIVNTNLVPSAEAPKSVEELTSPKWRGRVAMAYPIYGTTAAHMVALRQAWGDEKWKAWCEKLVANKPFVVDGNSIVVKLVGNGEALIGLTDSDDFAAGKESGLPIASIEVGLVPAPTGGCLRIFNSIGILNKPPHPAEAKAFFDYVQSEGALKGLLTANALEGTISESRLDDVQTTVVEETREILQKIFARR
jgi:iron(III) transport system substrate-binding protein